MARTYYAQSEKPEPTLTVGELITKLQAFDPGDRVIFRSPQFGCFGSNQAYSVDDVAHETLEAFEQHNPAHTYEDDETGKTVHVEAETQRWPSWSGVVIR